MINALNSGVNSYFKMVSSQLNGRGFINRPEKATFVARRFKYLCAQSSWFKPKVNDIHDDQSHIYVPNIYECHCPQKRKSNTAFIDKIENNKKRKYDPGPETILFVPFTPKSELRKQVQEMENQLNAGNKCTKLKVIERNGQSLASQLCNKTPWRQQACQDPLCFPCVTQPGACRKQNVTYRLVCVPCALKGVSSVYIGESHRTWGERAQEHHRAIETGNKNYATVRHHLECHPGQPNLFTFH